MRFLVAYGSRHGGTADIAFFIAKRLRQRGHDVTVAEAGVVTDVSGYDGAVVGSALYAGRWLKEPRDLVLDHASFFRTIPTWLFSSGPIGNEITRDDEQQPSCLPKLEVAIGPRGHTIFGGRLEKDRLGWSERMMLMAVRAHDGDYRRWDVIAAWADAVALAATDLRKVQH
jgi:menaquinone-dependent protoporphyrinogen oxidase